MHANELRVGIFHDIIRRNVVIKCPHPKRHEMQNRQKAECTSGSIVFSDTNWDLLDGVSRVVDVFHIFYGASIGWVHEQLRYVHYKVVKPAIKKSYLLPSFWAEQKIPQILDNLFFHPLFRTLITMPTSWLAWKETTSRISGLLQILFKCMSFKERPAALFWNTLTTLLEIAVMSAINFARSEMFRCIAFWFSPHVTSYGSRI